VVVVRKAVTGKLMHEADGPETYPYFYFYFLNLEINVQQVNIQY
jgi:hypothetical protein